ncbi:hypothetical protein [Phormidium nigroviride]
MIKVEFKHWRYEFTEDDLQYASRNKKRVANTKLRTALQKATLVQKEELYFTDEQILCANEAFPEAAVADPLADIRIWNEWRSGVRIFPYPGRYSKLSITNQPPKTNSTSSIGVIGEIMAGIFGQVLIGPEVLVRVIQEWPDFIFDSIDNRYAFLEAKASTQKIKITSNDKFGISGTELGECLRDAIQHQNLDPFVKVWYAFTNIQQIEPEICFSTQFIELDVNQSKRNGTEFRVSELVIDGLAERTIQKGIFRFQESRDYGNTTLKSFSKRGKSNQRKEAEEIVVSLSKAEIDSVLENREFSTEARARLKEKIEEKVHDLVIPELSEGDEFWYYNPISSNDDRNILIRKLGLDSLYKRELSIDERTEIAKKWKPNLDQANQYWKIGDNNEKLWRCSSVAFSLVSKPSD